MAKTKDEWKAIEQVSRNKDEEIYRKFCYVLERFEQATKLLRKLEAEIAQGLSK